MSPTYSRQLERDMADIFEVMKYKKEIKAEDIPLYITIVPPSRVALALKILVDRGVIVIRIENNLLTYVFSESFKPG